MSPCSNAVVTSNMGASARKEKSRLRVSRHVRAAQGGRLKAARRYKLVEAAKTGDRAL
jgi:hypothetical protein